MARPLIAQATGRRRPAVGADALAHGCTGKGNDQVRFELTYMSLSLPISRSSRRGASGTFGAARTHSTYAAAHNVPVSATTAKIYSRDRNLWHISHEGGILEDPNSVPPKDLFMLTTDPGERTEYDPEDVTIGFEHGTPVSVNGETLDPVALARRSSTRSAASTASDASTSSRIASIGMKSRGVYETPGGTLLYTAHSELEQLVLDRRTLAAKDLIAPRYADLVYEGRWWTTEREAYDAFVNVDAGARHRHDHAAPLQGHGHDRRSQERPRTVRRALRHLRRGRRLRAERRRRLHSSLRSLASACVRSRTWRCRAADARRGPPRPSGAMRRSIGTRRRMTAAEARSGTSHKLWGGRFAAGPRPALDAAQPLDRHRLPSLAVRRSAVQGVGGRPLERRRR